MYIVYLFLVFCASEGFSQAPPINPLITHIKENDIIYYLYNRENQSEPTKLTKNNIKEVNANKTLKIIIHGFTENAKSDWYKDMTREYLEKDDYNIIQVDWSKPASSVYSISASNTRTVGTFIGNFISSISNNQNVPLKNIHLIGHSLGAHVAGYAGKEIIKQIGMPVGRISALDAAGPLFEGIAAVFTGLDKRDAVIVDAIHTDGGFFGRINPVGTIDFFPNGGIPPQPGCSIVSFKLPPMNYVQLSSAVFCSHTKSHDYFISSINKETFVGTRCDSWRNYLLGNCNEELHTIMGEGYSFNKSDSGSYFLKTNSVSPFAQN